MKDMDKLDRVDRGSPRQWGLEHLPREERLRAGLSQPREETATGALRVPLAPKRGD